jgi:cbb3-type cytochrome oxidase subunit 3
MKKNLFLIIGLLYLIALEIAKVYFIMPFPGSQQINSIDIAYFIHQNILWLRLLGLLIITVPCIYYFQKGKKLQQIILAISLIFYAVVFYAFNFHFLADKMFLHAKNIDFKNAGADSTNKNKLVIGVTMNGKSKAYPIDIIGYHHQIQDSIDGQPILVTYCTVCRTGRVYSPKINGIPQQFRLVGMDHFNAMFEDASTKSWWQQATGTAITGKLKGTQLVEIPAKQLRLADWIEQNPSTAILQPDALFKKEYADLKGFDDGTIKSSLEKRDTGSWKFKSWVVGINLNGQAKAYDWNYLVKKTLINDAIMETPIIITVEANQQSFYAFSSLVNGEILQFSKTAEADKIIDLQTNSIWTRSGKSVEGPLKGTQLKSLQAYQEFWHSWQYFHPKTGTYPK